MGATQWTGYADVSAKVSIKLASSPFLKTNPLRIASVREKSIDQRRIVVVAAAVVVSDIESFSCERYKSQDDMRIT